MEAAGAVANLLRRLTRQTLQHVNARPRLGLMLVSQLRVLVQGSSVIDGQEKILVMPALRPTVPTTQSIALPIYSEPAKDNAGIGSPTLKRLAGR